MASMPCLVVVWQLCEFPVKGFAVADCVAALMERYLEVQEETK